MGKSKGERRRAQWAAREAAYQEALNARERQESDAAPVGQTEEKPAPDKRKPRKKPVREKRPGSQLSDVRPREVRCPRCLAQTGTSCQNGRGEPVGAHADRKRKAAEKGRRPPKRAIEQDQLLRYLDGGAEPTTGRGRNPVDELFAARRDAATTRNRTMSRRRRIDGL